jgi:transcriptional regulator GlxA family with amidase domain
MCKNPAMGLLSNHVSPHRVVVLALDDVVGFDLCIPPEIFGSAGKHDDNPRYEVLVCGLRPGTLPTSAGFSVVIEHGPELLATADTVVIPGTHIEGPLFHGTLPDDLAAALATLRPGTRIMSICTGSFVLAAAGLLDGRPAATHWRHAERFRRLYPQVELDADVLYVDDGDILSSAGVAAGIDLCLHVIRSDHGSEVANHAARRCVVPPWREGGQSQFIERPMPEATGSSTAATREWATNRLAEPLNLAQLAGHARMSVRTFTRRFREEVGVSPGKWLVQQRVDRARHLLENTDLAVDRVAAESGIGSASALRQQLNTAIGVAPLAYRRTFSRT